MPSLRLMIVDDSTIIRSKISRTHDITHFKLVATATNGLDAVDIFKETLPDVVTMDLTMPKMDDITCIDKLITINPMF